VAFKVSKIEERIEIMKYSMEINVDILNMVSKIKFQSFKDDIKSNMESKDDVKEMAQETTRKHVLKYMKGDLIKELRNLLNLNYPPKEEDKENKGIKSQSHMDNNLTHLDNTKIESWTLSISPHHCGFNSRPKNYFISNIDMMIDGNDLMGWIFYMEKFFNLH
jgi:hypothetical protein